MIWVNLCHEVMICNDRGAGRQFRVFTLLELLFFGIRRDASRRETICQRTTIIPVYIINMQTCAILTRRECVVALWLSLAVAELTALASERTECLVAKPGLLCKKKIQREGLTLSRGSRVGSPIMSHCSVKITTCRGRHAKVSNSG